MVDTSSVYNQISVDEQNCNRGTTTSEVAIFVFQKGNYMAVFRTIKNKNYTCMSNYHLRDKNLSLKAKGLLSIILSLPEDWNYSAKGLETLSTDGNTTVRNTLKELEENHYLIRKRIYKDGKISDWEYIIFESKEQYEDYINTNDLQVVENQQQEIFIQENNNNKILKQSNTKKVNKEIKNNTKVLLAENSAESNTFLKSSSSLPRKQNKYSKCVSLIHDFTVNEKLIAVLVDYLNMLLEADKSMYTNQFKGKLNKLKRLTDDERDMIVIVEQSIQFGWKSFYPLNKDNYRFNNSGGGFKDNIEGDKRELPPLEECLSDRSF